MIDFLKNLNNKSGEDMRLGYACINMSLPSKFKTCRLATVEKKGKGYIKELTLHNFNETLRIIKWNIEQEILFYRISSDLVVFGSHPINDWEWWEDPDVLEITSEIKRLKDAHQLRLSCHPGQFNILNSPKKEVVLNTLSELTYHDRMMNLMGGTDMILHIGGAYGDKEAAKQRFIQNYALLDDSIKRKLRIENDDKIFNLQDVLDVSKETHAPICFDFHHDRCHPSDIPAAQLIGPVFKSWRSAGKPKVHISSGKTSPTDRSHHDYVFMEDLKEMLDLFDGRDVDVMFECKMKDKAVLRIMADDEAWPLLQTNQM